MVLSYSNVRSSGNGRMWRGICCLLPVVVARGEQRRSTQLYQPRSKVWAFCVHETRQTVHVYRITEARLWSHCCCGNAMSITCSECGFVALVMQSASALLSYVAFPAVPYFCTLPRTRHDYRKNFIEHKMCVLIFFTAFIWNISHFEYEFSKISWMYIGLLVKYQLFVLDFNENWIFSTDFRKESLNTSLHENPSSWSGVVPCGQTDGHEANSRFSKCCEWA